MRDRNTIIQQTGISRITGAGAVKLTAPIGLPLSSVGSGDGE